MAIIDNIPGFSVDIRSATDDNIAFTEYNPGEKKQQVWPSEIDPSLAGGPADGEVEIVPAESISPIFVADDDENDGDYAAPNRKGGKRRASSRAQPKRNTKAKQSTTASMTTSRTHKTPARKLEVNPDSVCTRYIETSSQPFRICFTWSPQFIYKQFDIQADIIIDGKLVEDRVFFAEDLMADEGPEGWAHFVGGVSRTRVKPGGRGGEEWIEKGISFGQLDVDEDFRGIVPQAIEKAMKDVGKITIKLWRVKAGKKQAGSNKPWKDLKNHVRVPEKALKGEAVSLETSFCTTKKIKPITAYDTEPIDDWDVPFATFNFCYRTLDDLEALHIIAHSKELEEKPVSELTPEDNRILAAKWRARSKTERRQLRKLIKQEYSVQDPNDEDGDVVEFINKSSRGEDFGKGKCEGKVNLKGQSSTGITIINDDEDDHLAPVQDAKPQPRPGPGDGTLGSGVAISTPSTPKPEISHSGDGKVSGKMEGPGRPLNDDRDLAAPMMRNKPLSGPICSDRGLQGSFAVPTQSVWKTSLYPHGKSGNSELQNNGEEPVPPQGVPDTRNAPIMAGKPCLLPGPEGRGVGHAAPTAVALSTESRTIYPSSVSGKTKHRPDTGNGDDPSDLSFAAKRPRTFADPRGNDSPVASNLARIPHPRPRFGNVGPAGSAFDMSTYRVREDGSVEVDGSNWTYSLARGWVKSGKRSS